MSLTSAAQFLHGTIGSKDRENSSKLQRVETNRKTAFKRESEKELHHLDGSNWNFCFLAGASVNPVGKPGPQTQGLPSVLPDITHASKG